jgi:hypothetical protein
MRIGLFSALSFSAVFGACNCQEGVVVLAPKIEIGDPYDPTFSVCGKQFVRECKFDFGAVPIGQGKFFSFMIKNPSPVDLSVMSVKLEQDGEEFAIEGDVPTKIESDVGTTGKMVTIKFIPRTETPLRAKVVIDSNAENLEPKEKVVIELTATGADMGAPIIQVTPAECDFGDVGVGVRSLCSLSIFNAGNRELAITGVDMDRAGDVFGPEGAFIVPTFVPAGTGVSMTVHAIPASTDVVNGSITIVSNDEETGDVIIPLRVRGAQAPTAIGRVKSINGIPNSETNPEIEPLDDVVLSADNSVPGAAINPITEYLWEIVEKPVESSVDLTSATSMDTAFVFNNGGDVNGLDVVGTFVVRLTVTDNIGQSSTNDARVTLNAIPTEGLHVQLTWDVGVNDIDLHLAKGAPVDWCSTNDCYFGNCTGTGLDWDGAGGTSSPGDPHQDIDDLSGYGPENTNIDDPVNDQYTVGVDFWGGSSSTFVTIKIFLGGALSWESGAQMSNSSQFWEAARVDVNNGFGTVIPIENLQNTWSCY